MKMIRIKSISLIILGVSFLIWDNIRGHRSFERDMLYVLAIWMGLSLYKVNQELGELHKRLANKEEKS